MAQRRFHVLLAALPMLACSGVPGSEMPDEGAPVDDTELARAAAKTTPTLSGFGDPLAELKDGDLQAFADGQVDFIDAETLPALGPIFNSRECGACHFQPALGGSGAFINEVRIRNNPSGGPLHIFGNDNILRLGPQSQGENVIFESGVEATPLGCQMTHASCVQSTCQKQEAAATTFATTLPLCDPTSSSFANGANCTAERQSTALFGFGLIEAVADATFTAMAYKQPKETRGVVKTVTEFGQTRVARFGWKDDVATLRAFAGGAYLNEMGITNPDLPTELSSCALNQTQFGVLLDADDDPEDAIGDDGKADIDKFADFMRGLAPPPTVPQSKSAAAGEKLFSQVGCANCHVPSLTTDKNPEKFVPGSTGGVPISKGVAKALANRTFHPFSDFLLHDMGSLGDGITSGAAGPKQMRTAPLWGVRSKSRLLHDGRAEDAADAIELHDGQGAAARDAFEALTDAQKQNLLDYLRTI
jgi:Di-haem oxidoreductase, putative peroxidase